MNNKIILTEEENRILRKMLNKLFDLHDEIIQTQPPRIYKQLTAKQHGFLMSKVEMQRVNSEISEYNSQIKGYEYFINQVEDIISTLKDNPKVNSIHFLFFTYIAKAFSKKSNIVPEEAIKAFIKKCKILGVNCSFLTCFDNEANIIPEMLKKLQKELKVTPAYTCEKIVRMGKMEPREIARIILPKEKEEQILKILEEKKQIEAMNKQMSLMAEENKVKMPVVQIPKEVQMDDYNYERHFYDAYFNPQRQILKPSVIDNLTYEEFEGLLSSMPNITKKQKSDYLELYKNYKTEDVIRKSYSSLSMIQKQHLTFGEYEDIKDQEIFFLIRCLVFSDGYEALSPVAQLEKLKEIIDIYIDRKSDNRSRESSLLVFSDVDFIPSLIDDLSEQRNGYEDADTLKKINTQLEKLKHISIEELRAGKSFHPVMYGDEAVDLNGIKGYRFGDKTCKIFFFRLSVHNDNKIALKSRYNLAETPDVLLVYYVGDVKRVDEEKLYDDANSYFDYYSQVIGKISDIFEYPFDDDTADIAYKLIDSGYSNMEKLRNATLACKTEGISR